jgi:uncharacterized membrane protein
MAQEKEIKKENNNLPAKTKIAGWWLSSISSCLVVLGLFLVVYGNKGSAGYPLGSSLAIVLGGIFIIFNLPIFISAIFLFKGRRWAWYAGEIFLGFNILSEIFLSYLYLISADMFGFLYILFTLLLIIPFVLLLSDRKNFFKVAK